MYKKLKWKFLLSQIIVLFMVFCSVNVFAINLPVSSGYVTDTVGVVSKKDKAVIQYLASELKLQTGIETAVCVVGSTGGYSIEDYATQLFAKWGVGEKSKDNGVLLLVAVKDRKMRIEVGYGLEGVITDGSAGQIRDAEILPYFRGGKYSQGILSGYLGIFKLVQRQYPVRINTNELKNIVGNRGVYTRTESSVFSNILGLLIMLVIVFAFFKGGWRFLLALFLLQSSSRISGNFGGFGGNSFGGFGGGMSGGGGASGSW
jgi:uncharacterized protein